MPLIEYSSAPGAMVLDPFGGSGSTAIACKELKRHCILIEGRDDYVAIAEARLRNSASLFDMIA